MGTKVPLANDIPRKEGLTLLVRATGLNTLLERVNGRISEYPRHAKVDLLVYHI